MYNDRTGREKRKKGKVLVVASVASMIDQFNIPNIRLLISLGYEADVACNFQKGSTCSDEKIKELLDLLEQLQADCYQIDFERSPFDLKAAARAYRQLDRVLKGTARTIHGKQWHKDRKPYCFIHAHSPVGGAIGRIAAGRNHAASIYTAHGFHFYHGAPLKNWLLYYPAEIALSRITDVLVTINREDYKRAKKKLHAKKTVYIPGVGADTEKFGMVKTRPAEKRRELGLPEDSLVLLSAGELNENKNHASVIRALALLKKEAFFPKVQYVICGKGTPSREHELERLAEGLGISRHVRLLGFRQDMPDIYGCADIFILPSKREGLPAALMEAMAAGLAVICSDIRGNTDLVRNHVNSLACSMAESETAGLIKRLAADERLRKQLGANAAWDIRRLDISRMDFSMKKRNGKMEGQGYRRAEALAERINIRKQHGIAADAFVLISAGELNENKNHGMVIEAVAELGDSHACYIICGQGSRKAEYEKLIREKGLEGRVILAGFQKEMAAYYHASDAFVLPSKREGLGMAALEAMSAGLPLISSDAGGIKDYSEDGVTGIVLPNGSGKKEYAQALGRIQDKQKWKFYSDNAAARALDFGKNVTQQKMMRIYKGFGR